jgi:hypothetical protein
MPYGSMVYGKTVTVDSVKRDRYGRIIGEVLVNGIPPSNVELSARGADLEGMEWRGRVPEISALVEAGARRRVVKK